MDGYDSGQNVGRFDRFLAQAGVPLDAAFTLNMPNNFIEVWDEGRQRRCLEAAERRIREIAEAVMDRERVTDVRCVLNGRKATESTVAFAPRMNAQWSATLSDTSDFRVTGAYVGCGICERVCNGHAIRLEGGRPAWGEGCTKCLACLHLCPQRAIQFGPYTEGARRYRNPHVSVSEFSKRWS